MSRCEDVYESIAPTESVLQAGAGGLVGLAVASAGPRTVARADGVCVRIVVGGCDPSLNDHPKAWFFELVPERGI